ncbi:MAG: hypothetical protein J6T94_04625 [Bacteroidaceae bacterium]|nr:hypothetical protein [Bacteroidaceae bacterium]
MKRFFICKLLLFGITQQCFSMLDSFQHRDTELFKFHFIFAAEKGANNKSAMRHLLLFLIFVVTWGTSFSQQTIILPSGRVVDKILSEMPSRDVVQQDDGFVVTYSFGEIIKIENFENEGTYYLKIPGFGLNHEEGKPCIPTRWDSFVIPDTVNYQVEIVDSDFIETNIVLSPAHELDVVSESDIIQPEVSQINDYTGLYPQALVDMHQTQQYGNSFLLNIRVCPIQYDLRNNKARLFTKISYKVKYNREEENVKLFNYRNSNLAKDSYLFNTTLNYPILCNSNNTKSLLPNEPNRSLDNRDYLIISITEYAEAVNRFANWKKTLGFNTHIVLKNRGQWTSSGVSTVIQEAKINYPDLSFMVIIGDNQDVPAMNKGTHVTDYLYLNSDNYISPISNGRLSVSTASEAVTVIDKILDYERTPITDSLFYKKALCCAFFQDGDSINDPDRMDSILCQYDKRRFVKTAEEVRSHLMLQGKNVSRVYYAYPGATPKYWNNGRYSFGEEIPQELQKPNFLWDGNSGDINNGLSEGTFCVVFNDHGHPLGWRDPWYHSDFLSSVHNNSKLPVVFSMCCKTGCFNDTTCFAEQFIRKSDGGCVAIFAATGDGYSGFDDALTEGMIDAIWPNPSLIPQFPYHTQNVTPTPEPTYYLGHILKQGFKRMEETWGSGMYIRERFHCFGDPSMRIRTNTPTSFSNATISRSANSINVQTGEGIARITFYDHRTDSVISYMDSTAFFTGITDAVSVCISGHNKIPLVDERNLIYIQNRLLSSSDEIEADVIIAGKNVTNQMETGEVRFVNGRTVLKGNTIELHGGTSVSLGAKLEIKSRTP